ncbi:aldehyde oxidase 2 [Danaus plexippus plexippus]|uniref:Aldehyde oxidase 2 n=1 Tax=Danaus plexippus plexippus TaxID=278856 RepID=A0A212F791_DANPL|nr:aldehyde oxidase 2 [Danaus plexippus plexippus]
MDKISFTINGEHYSLSGSEVSASTTLNDYLRNNLGLVGTKAMCHEGGCGACIVTVAKNHPTTNERQIVAVNSCLVHILSCHEWDITTIEGVGNRKDGYHNLQTRLAKFNGTQCGYCTPGMIMNMYSLQKGADKPLTTKEIERAFAGNICRCTGYRSILDAFKTFSTDDYDDGLQDLEELHEIRCKKKNSICYNKDDWCFLDRSDELMNITVDPNKWYKAFSVEDIFKVLNKEGADSYRLVGGNTGKGVYPNPVEPRVHIDISSVDALKDVYKDVNLVLGVGLSLSELKIIFEREMKNEEFSYLSKFRDHLELVASIPVKNIGTIGGNLALKNAHPEFQSDIFIMFETVGATVTIVDKTLKKTEINLEKFLKLDLASRLMLNVKLPPLSQHNLIRTYKIMPRAQNAHAIVNAGFNFLVGSDKKITRASVIYGGISSTFTHATNVENMLKGLELFKDETLKKALYMLQQELVPLELPPEASPFTRKAIALGLFYKAMLSLSPSVSPRFASGGTDLIRPVSSGTQTYDTDKSLWPLNQPVPKLEALTQCSGEALYSCDAASPREAHVAFVLSSVCIGEIVGFDASEAMPVGVIAAVTRKLALRAAGLVKVSYKQDPSKPVLSIEDALNAPDKDKRIRQDVTIKAKVKGTDVTRTVRGDFKIPDQYHFTMEAQSCRVTHSRRGLTIRSATQWMDLVQVAIAQSLQLPNNRVDVEVERIGGGYGGKASRSSVVACACALVAYKLNKDASFVLPITDNMEVIGKRHPAYLNYEIGVNDNGLIQYANLNYYSDTGYLYNEAQAQAISGPLTNLYDTSRWNISGYSVLTDKASNTWCRAPGTTEANAMLEHIMERIAHATNRDSIAVRKANIALEHNTLSDMIDKFVTDSRYKEREADIETFNTNNAWKKRAMKLSIMSFPLEYYGNFSVIISVFHGDGTILISHGGIEMGQGINTKIAQVCAYSLKVPLKMVAVKGADNFISPNNMASSGSITSECVAFATIKACDELLSRLEPVRLELKEPTWEEVIKAAHNKGIDLQASSSWSLLDDVKGYSIYGIGSLEVELDVLTGVSLIRRVDLLEDTGRSMNPEVDVGQIEGAFIMGLGLWTSEKLIYDETGKLLTNRTWSYKPPGACDIPIDFRITFKRNSYNNNGVLRSKATGEPALVLSVVVALALHDAILEARKEYGYVDVDWLHVDTPYTVDNIIRAISPNINSYRLK